VCDDDHGLFLNEKVEAILSYFTYSLFQKVIRIKNVSNTVSNGKVFKVPT